MAAFRERLPGFSPATIFDVGANEGEVALALATAFPNAEIFAFEPVAATYLALIENVRANPKIRTVNLALGRKIGRARMRIKSISVSNRMAGWRDMFKKTEFVRMQAGSDVAAELGVAKIDFLKIDTEGHDLEVLRGFRKMLESHRIALVEAEVGLNPENRRHVRFESVKAFLEKLGYRLFLIYEQVTDTPFSGRPILRRANVVFLSPLLIEATRQDARLKT